MATFRRNRSACVSLATLAATAAASVYVGPAPAGAPAAAPPAGPAEQAAAGADDAAPAAALLKHELQTTSTTDHRDLLRSLHTNGQIHPALTTNGAAQRLPPQCLPDPALLQLRGRSPVLRQLHGRPQVHQLEHQLRHEVVLFAWLLQD